MRPTPPHSTPAPSPAAVYRISERAPIFPCWLYVGYRPLSGGTPSWEYVTACPDMAAWNVTHWSPDAPEAPKDAPDDGWEARDQEANGYPIPAPTALSPAEATPLEGVNTVGWPASKMQDHVFDCHEEIRGLRDQLTVARQDLANQERTTDAYYKEMHGPDGYRVRLDAAESQLISARRESEGLREERDRALGMDAASNNRINAMYIELATLRAELEKAKGHIKWQFDELAKKASECGTISAKLSALQSALGKAEIFEVVDATDEERYWPMGVFLNEAEAMAVLDAVEPPNNEGEHEAVTFEVRRRKTGFAPHDYTKIAERTWVHDWTEERPVWIAKPIRSAQGTPGEGKGEDSK